MNFLIIDVIYYIGTFLRNPTKFYHAIPNKQDLYKCFGDEDFVIYVSYLIRHKCFRELTIIKKYTNFHNLCISYNIKYFDEYIFDFCLKNINEPDYFKFFKCAFYYNNVNAVKQLMEYENICELKNPKSFLHVLRYNVNCYNKNLKLGCGINIDAFKYYLCHTIHKNVLEKHVSKNFTNLYEKLEKSCIINSYCRLEKSGIMDSYWLFEKSIFYRLTYSFIRNYLFFKNIVHIETLIFKNLFKKYNVIDELTNYFTFDFTFEDMN